MTSLLRSSITRPLRTSTNTRTSSSPAKTIETSLKDTDSTDSSKSSLSRRITRRASQLLRKQSRREAGKENDTPATSSTPTSTPRSSLSTTITEPSTTPILPRSVSSPIVVPPPAFIPSNSPAPPRRSDSLNSNPRISLTQTRANSPAPPERAALNISRTRFLGASSTYIDLTRLPSRSITLPPLLESHSQASPIRSTSFSSLHSTSTRRTSSLNRNFSNGNYEGGRRLHVNGPDRPGWTKVPANIQLREVVNTPEILTPKITSTGIMQLDGPDDAESARNWSSGARDIAAGTAPSLPTNTTAQNEMVAIAHSLQAIVTRKQNRTSDTGRSTRGSDVPRLERLDSVSEASVQEERRWRKVIEDFLERARCWLGFRFGVALW